ncbi:hypothetical protein E4U54_006503 [Claviceps lovelessii]|nr:hypothetical protein E4U54_006503 [Claviceps lovelessii]
MPSAVLFRGEVPKPSHLPSQNLAQQMHSHEDLLSEYCGAKYTNSLTQQVIWSAGC